jgi:hypothetical protein
LVFSIQEGPGGLKHFALRWQRLVLGRPRSHFLPNYSGAGIEVEEFCSYDGQPANCQVCGYALLRATLPNGWRIETCSALPAFPQFGSREFNDWLASLPDTKLPTACV